MDLGHALSTPVVYYSPSLNVCDFNATDLFSWRLRGERGEAAWTSFTVNSQGALSIIYSRQLVPHGKYPPGFTSTQVETERHATNR